MKKDNLALSKFKMDAVKAKRIVALCVESGKVIFVAHAVQRMHKRLFTDVVVLNCLRHGRIVEGPAMDPSGMWRFTMMRDVGAVRLEREYGTDDPDRNAVPDRPARPRI